MVTFENDLSVKFSNFGERKENELSAFDKDGYIKN
jgi:hypothetical protein